jgi:hypothetical protein
MHSKLLQFIGIYTHTKNIAYLYTSRYTNILLVFLEVRSVLQEALEHFGSGDALVSDVLD